MNELEFFKSFSETVLIFVFQAKCYDPEGDYIRIWCPEIGSLPTEFLHDPSLISSDARATYRLSEDSYPWPCVELLHREYKMPKSGGMTKKKKEKMEAHGKIPGFQL